MLWPVAAVPYVHSKLAPGRHHCPYHRSQFLTEEEWLAHRDAQQANSRLITDDVSDAVVIDPQEEH